MAKLTIFAGPSRSGATWPIRMGETDLTWRPPARRGDFDAWVRNESPGTLVLVDGVFHHELPPSHAELRRALRAGWVVWGVASLGAIRACEMQSVGMRGFGSVYDAYCADPELTDDEVALLHGPGPEFLHLSEPLVHLRAAVRDAVARGALTNAAAEAVVGELRRCWYGERVLARFSKLVCMHADARLAEEITAPTNVARYRLKQQDLRAALPTIVRLHEGRG